MADVRRYHHQLCLLLSGGASGKEKTDGRNADDTQNRGLYLDDWHGAWIDRKINLKLHSEHQVSILKELIL